MDIASYVFGDKEAALGLFGLPVAKKNKSPSNSGIVAFRGIDRKVPIYPKLLDIAEGALQRAAL